MFEQLTAYIPTLDNLQLGGWVERRDKGELPQSPNQVTWDYYGNTALRFIKDIDDFVGAHPELGLTDYRKVLEDNHIVWGFDSMVAVDVSALDGKAVVGLLVGAYRADYWSEGALIAFCESGSIKRWLLRLRDIDSKSTSEESLADNNSA